MATSKEDTEDSREEVTEAATRVVAGEVTRAEVSEAASNKEVTKEATRADMVEETKDSREATEASRAGMVVPHREDTRAATKEDTEDHLNKVGTEAVTRVGTTTKELPEATREVTKEGMTVATREDTAEATSTTQPEDLKRLEGGLLRTVTSLTKVTYATLGGHIRCDYLLV